MPGYERIHKNILLIDYNIDRRVPDALTWPKRLRVCEAGSSSGSQVYRADIRSLEARSLLRWVQ
jgi:hypothetical protein